MVNRKGKGVLIEQRQTRLWALRFVTTAVTIGWMLFIYFLSSKSPDELRSLDTFSWMGATRDTAGHLVLFGVLGSLLLAAAWSWVKRPGSLLRLVALTITIGTLYGALDEFHQSFVPGRSPTISDVLVDGVGAALGAISIRYVVTALTARGQRAGQSQ